MAPIVPDPKKIRSFASEAAFEKWLSAHHDRETVLWLKFYKKHTGVRALTYPEALDVALCWGWIDGLKKSHDDKAFLVRFSPRRPKSIWSQINRRHVARLVKAGRMTPHGQRHVDAAKADGRWANAYKPIRSLTVADIAADVRAAIDANPRARKALDTLSRRDLLVLVFRPARMKTPAARARMIRRLVADLGRT